MTSLSIANRDSEAAVFHQVLVPMRLRGNEVAQLKHVRYAVHSIETVGAVQLGLSWTGNLGPPGSLNSAPEFINHLGIFLQTGFRSVEDAAGSYFGLMSVAFPTDLELGEAPYLCILGSGVVSACRVEIEWEAKPVSPAIKASLMSQGGWKAPRVQQTI